MNLQSCARYLSSASTALPALLIIGGTIWAIWRGHMVREPAALIAFAIVISPSVVALTVVYVALRYKRILPLFLLWTFALGVAAPFIPPTILELVLPCPPPAIRCDVIGTTSWPVLLACICGAALACFASWIELGQHHQQYQLTTSGNRLKTLSAVMALFAGMILIWLHHDFDARSIEGAVYVALRSERARAAGGIPFHDVVDGPSESLTLLFGIIATLTVGAASLRGNGRWLIYLWPFVMGVVWPQVTGLLGSVGAFGWAYRTFAEKYGWATLVIICVIGLLTAELGKEKLHPNQSLSPG